jgi:hypothetical protein
MTLAIRDTIQDCNLNVLVGSGLSSPYLKTLGQIEALLTLVERSELANSAKRLIQCSLYRSYFEGVISKNCRILTDDPEAEPILNNYYDFLSTIRAILLRRKSTILGKEANVFTTNIDMFMEKAVERAGFECNDGFSGRFAPQFAVSNFKKSHFRRSPQYDNVSELPTVNLLKLHGSVTWQIGGDDKILFSRDLSHVAALEALCITPDVLLDIGAGATLESLMLGCQGKQMDASLDGFLDGYENLLIVNPTKAKFKQTLLNQTHYELLRIYSNELEKENTILLVLGFSFSDEHIREITLRAANSNPTLVVLIYAYDAQAAAEIQTRFPSLDIRNANIQIIAPPRDENGRDLFKYDLPTITKRELRAILDFTDRLSGPEPTAPGGA